MSVRHFFAVCWNEAHSFICRNLMSFHKLQNRGNVSFGGRWVCRNPLFHFFAQVGKKDEIISKGVDGLVKPGMTQMKNV